MLAFGRGLRDAVDMTSKGLCCASRLRTLLCLPRVLLGDCTPRSTGRTRACAGHLEEPGVRVLLPEPDDVLLLREPGGEARAHSEGARHTEAVGQGALGRLPGPGPVRMPRVIVNVAHRSGHAAGACRTRQRQEQARAEAAGARREGRSRGAGTVSGAVEARLAESRRRRPGAWRLRADRRAAPQSACRSSPSASSRTTPTARRNS